MARILTPEQAAGAIYFDFEGCVGEAPALLGWCFHDENGAELFRQAILDPALCSATRTVPHTNGRVRCSRSTLMAAVLELVSVAEEYDRVIVSWAAHDMRMIEAYVPDPTLVERARQRYMNALPTARQWLRRVHPSVEFERGWGGRHNLHRYRELMRIYVPEKYDRDVAARGIAAIRQAIVLHGSYGAIPTEANGARAAWKAVLGHNCLDCRTTREVVTRAAEEYADTLLST